jgi:peptidyl-tRNA hydrolase
MNNSGGPVAAAAAHFNVKHPNIIVVADDFTYELVRTHE